MKKSDFYTLQDDHICFQIANNSYLIKDIKQIEVITQPIRKNASDTILNSIANAASSSIANGNEKVYILVRVNFTDTHVDLQLNNEPLVKGNLDYYEMMEHAHNLRDAIKKDCAR